MLKKQLTILIGALFCFAFLSAQASSFKIKTWHLTNGVTVYFVESKTIPTLGANLIFTAGSAYDGNYKGLAAMTNSMIGQATLNKNSDQIASGFDSIGAELNSDISRDYSSFALRTLTDKKYLTKAVLRFADVIANARFKDSDFNRIKLQTFAAINSREQQPDYIASKIFNKAVYAGYPYAFPIIGTKNSLTTLSVDKLKHFYHQYYVGSNAKLVMVGDLSIKQAKKISNLLAGSLSRGQVAAKLNIVPEKLASLVKHVDFPSQQTAIILGQLGVLPNSKNQYALAIANNILGQMPLNSVLFQQVRNSRGLAYSATSTFVSRVCRGTFYIQAKTRAAKTKEAVAVIRQTLKDYISHGPTKAQFNSAKKYINGSFPLSYASNAGILNLVSKIAIYDLPVDYANNYLKNINTVTLDQVKTALQKSLNPKKMTLVTVGPSLQNEKSS